MKRIPQTTHSLLLATLLLGASSGLSAIHFEEAFDTLPGSGWTPVYSGTNTGQQTAAAPRIENYEGHDWLRLQRNGTTGSTNATYYYTGSGSGPLPDGSLFSTLSGSVVMRLDHEGSSVSGVMLHAQDVQYISPGGYFIGIKPGTGNGNTIGGLGIYRNPGTHTQPGTELAFTPWQESGVSRIDNNYSYRLEFAINDVEIEARLWQLDSNDIPIGETPYAEVHYVLQEADIWTAGYFGLRSAFQNNATTYYRDLDLNVTVIPEAKHMAMILALIPGAWILLRRRAHS